MVRKCCATNCNGNYNAEKKVKMFKLPRNPEGKEKVDNHNSLGQDSRP